MANHWLLRAALVLAGLLVVGGGEGAAASGDPSPRAIQPSDWRFLGPAGFGDVYRLGVSTGWPQDTFILAGFRTLDLGGGTGPQLGQPPAARSRDGGQTWEPLATEIPPGSLTIAPRPGGGRIAFIVASPNSYDFAGKPVSGQFLRSEDDGDSWQTVMSLNQEDEPEIALSPSFERDGIALFSTGKALHRSTDSGKSWAVLDPAPGQRLKQIRFSPAFWRDQTAFLVATTNPFRGAGYGLGEVGESATNDASVGLMVSVDGGRDWTVAPGQPSHLGTSYRSIQTLAVSPSFGDDGVLFAFSWAWWPHLQTGPGYHGQYHAALFRSTDRARTWEHVWEIESVQTVRGSSMPYRSYAGIVLSPDFVQNRTAFMTVVTRSGSPSGSGCWLRRSSDGGASWLKIPPTLPPGGSTFCSSPRFAAQAPLTAVWHVAANGMGAVKSRMMRASPSIR